MVCFLFFIFKNKNNKGTLRGRRRKNQKKMYTYNCNEGEPNGTTHFKKKKEGSGSKRENQSGKVIGAKEGGISQFREGIIENSTIGEGNEKQIEQILLFDRIRTLGGTGKSGKTDIHLYCRNALGLAKVLCC